MAAVPTALFIGQDNLLTECARVWTDRGHAASILTQSPKIRRWAEARALEVHSSDPIPEQLADFDFLFSVTHLELLPPSLLERPKVAAINFHDGPLPAYAGLNTPVWGLMNGESNWGIRWHLMTADVDAGDIVEQENFEVAPDETALSLNTKNFAAGLAAFERLVPKLASGTWSRTPQEGRRKVYLRRERPSAACLLDLRTSAAAVARQVRALDFGPYPNPVGLPKLLVPQGALVVTAAEVVEREEGHAAGEILALGDQSLTVACREGAVRFSGLRSPGGEAVDGVAIRRALGLDAGDVLPEVPAETEWSDRLARNEPFWSHRLRTHVPLDLAPAEDGDPMASQDLILGRSRISLRLPADFTSEELSAAWAAYLARIRQRDQVDVAVPVDFEGPRSVRSLAVQWVPLRFRLPPEARLADAARHWTAERARVERRGPYLHDLVPRTQAEGRPFEVGVIDRGGTGFAPGVCLDVTDAALEITSAAVAGRDIDALRSRFEVFLTHLGRDPDVPLSQVSLLDDAERTRLASWSRHEVPVSGPDTVTGQFEAQVDRTPDRVAVTDGSRSWTYRELDGRANALARALRESGCGPGRRVGIHLDRGLELVLAPLAVMKAGAAYVPLDPSYPVERIRFMAEDADLHALITSSGRTPPVDRPTVSADGHGTAERLPPEHGAEDLAYVIYTSGSTGQPKGVEVEHRNVVNFFAGMDERVPRESEAREETWLAVTSLSFDISVLELFWTLARGFRVVVHAEGSRGSSHDGPMAFGLFMWGNDDAPGPEKYRLLLEGAEYLDAAGFESVWTPERHFHAFGGPYPNPAVTGAAVAARTRNMSIRAGSCVSPLHHPIRVAEEWAVVDNLSNGRVGLSFASGWQPDDFVLRPESFGRNKEVMFEQIEQVRALWRGDAVPFPHPMGHQVELRSLPRPVQGELPVWVTSAGNPETYVKAGEIGANVLTHLLGQSVDEVAEKIALYRQARERAGHDRGHVTLMLHTLVGDSVSEVREVVRDPLKRYLESSLGLLKKYAWTFPAFKSSGSAAEVDLDALSPEEVDAMMEHAFDRYFQTSGLFGTVDACLAMVDRLKAVGVDEIACLLDFGVPTERVMQSLPQLVELRQLANTRSAPRRSVGSAIREHGVTHVQCTPSLARMALQEDPSAFDGLPHLLLGGEALPPELAQRLSGRLGRTLSNMYGPTETTVWSSVHRVWTSGDLSTGPEPAATVPLGRPIANTALHVMDPALQTCPPGVEGELYIGGRGVVRGYLKRPELTAERFVETPYGRLYRTGDRARWESDGRLTYLGRIDGQVKVRGHRIEVGEIEAALAAVPEIRAAVVLASKDALVAYVQAAPGFDEARVRNTLRGQLPPFMVPGRIEAIDAFPLTPNGKIDRRALATRRPPHPAAEVEALEPSSPVETQIRWIWSEALGRADIRATDNFFDIGGHSLLVVQVHQTLKERLQRPLSLTDLYRFPTIRSLAAHLDAPAATSEDVLTAATSRAARRKQLLRSRR